MTEVKGIMTVDHSAQLAPQRRRTVGSPVRPLFLASWSARDPTSNDVAEQVL
jgi:hypothetical protein